MSRVASGLFWIAVYLGLVLTPIAVLFLGEPPPPGGFWWDLSIALGFAGLTMMGVQFLLTARFKRATAPFGIDIIYYFHRYAAVAGFLIVVAHPVVLFVNDPSLLFYLDPRAAPGFMTAGVLSIVALATIVVTSIWRAKLRLHYDAWRLIHSALAAGAVLLALWHVHSIRFYLSDPWKRNLWTVITLSWVAVLIYVRVVKPWMIRRHPFRVTEVRPERGDAWTLAMEPEGHAGFEHQPGQFAWLTIGHGPFAMKEHPFSIASAPGLPAGRVEFTIKELGDFTRTVGRLQRGTTAWVDAPYGAFSIDRLPAAGYVFLAGGIGIAPIMSMLRALAGRGDRRSHILFYAYRTWERLTFREELEAMTQTLDLKLVFALEEPPASWTGESGRIRSEMLARHLPQAIRLDRVYLVCGPQAMIQASERALRTLGVPTSRIHSELFNLV